MMIKKIWYIQLKINPLKEQKRLIDRTIKACRWVYDWSILQQNRYELENKKKIRPNIFKKKLTEIKSTNGVLVGVNSSALYYVLDKRKKYLEAWENTYSACVNLKYNIEESWIYIPSIWKCFYEDNWDVFFGDRIIKYIISKEWTIYNINIIYETTIEE